MKEFKILSQTLFDLEPFKKSDQKYFRQNYKFLNSIQILPCYSA